jgi:hypothetical protein
MYMFVLAAERVQEETAVFASPEREINRGNDPAFNRTRVPPIGPKTNEIDTGGALWSPTPGS